MLFENKLKRLGRRLRKLHNQKKKIDPLDPAEKKKLKELEVKMWEIEEEIRAELRKIEFIRVSHPEEILPFLHPNDNDS
jgi:predicted  nucleic acid-binding Zn-ribbon protein